MPFWAFAFPLRTIILGLRGSSSWCTHHDWDDILRIDSEDATSIYHCVLRCGEIWDFWRVFSIWLVLTRLREFFLPLGGVDNLQQESPLPGREWFWGSGHISYETCFLFNRLSSSFVRDWFKNRTRIILHCWVIGMDDVPSTSKIRGVGQTLLVIGSCLLIVTSEFTDGSWGAEGSTWWIRGWSVWLLKTLSL